MIQRRVALAIGLAAGLAPVGCAAPVFPQELARQRVMEVKGCAEKYIAEEDRLNHRFWLSGCGYVVSLRVVCDAKDCVPRGEQAMRVAVPARLKTTDGKLWVDPSPPLSEAPLDVKMDGGAVVRAGRVTAGRRLSDIRLPQHKPTLPPAYNRPGMVVWGLYKVCVSSGGDVRSVKVIKLSDPFTDPSWIAKIETWKYEPYAIDGKPVPFCQPVRLEVRAT